jgi:hypothetical protein
VDDGSHDLHATNAVTPPYAYRAPILEELARHGLQPRPSSSPGQLRDAVRDLYKYEIKRLRGELLAGRFPKSEYAGRVLALRRQYRVLSIPMELWLAPPDGRG